MATLGIAFLGSRGTQYQSANYAFLDNQARWLARSGIEDARTKLNRDWQFPPRHALGQPLTTYSEQVSDANGARVGSYEVTLDTTYQLPPYNLLKIESTGRVGPAEAPRAEHKVCVYIDMATTSAAYFKIIRFDDLGAI